MTMYQLLPPLTDEEYADLRADIVERGVIVPVLVDEYGAVIDGHHRLRICRELGIEAPRMVLAGLSEEEKEARSLSLNINRRQITRETRRQLVAALRERGWSTRRIAETVKADQSTVVRDIGRIDADASLPERIQTADGRSYPATRPNPPQEYVCTECGEVHATRTCPNCGEPEAAPGRELRVRDLPPIAVPEQSDEERFWHRLNATLAAIPYDPEIVADIAARDTMAAHMFLDTADESLQWFEQFIATLRDRTRGLRAVQ